MTETNKITVESLERAVNKLRRKPGQWPRTIWFVDVPDVLRRMLCRTTLSEETRSDMLLQIPRTIYGRQIHEVPRRQMECLRPPLNAPGVYVKFSDGSVKKIISKVLPESSTLLTNRNNRDN